MIRTHKDDPPLTAWEASKVAGLVARMAKREIAGPDVYQADLQKKLDRILNAARKRAEAEKAKKESR